MNDPARTDWSPGAYARFRGFRLAPAIDLLAQVPDLPDGDVVDLGCGDGAVAGPLRTRWPGRHLVGVDTSEAMLSAARGQGGYDRLVRADIARWDAGHPPAVIFSNAALNWVPDHADLLPRLVAMLAPGGTLAMQVPDQTDAPSHALIRALSGTTGTVPHVLQPADYARILSPFGAASVWRTEYLQRLAPVATGHPVRHFTQSTYMRPHVEAMDETDRAAFLDAYDAALRDAYPAERDGSVLFPFARLFCIVTTNR